MTGIDILIDTNIAIYAMEANPAVKGLAACYPAISVISEIELFGKKGISAAEINDIRNLIEGFPVIALDEKIKDIAIKLKQQYSIKTPDAIIAATAKSLGLILITADKGFAKINGIDAVIVEPRIA
jgi:predicted nucleic acid-binding protein